MQHYHQLDKEGLSLINFKKIFAVVQRKFMDQCDDYGIATKHDGKLNFRNKDLKRLILHNMIYGVCEEIINHRTKNKKVIIFRPLNRTDTFEILEYTTLPEINKLLLKIIGDIKKILPIQIVVLSDKISFQQLKEKLDQRDGETVELINKIFLSMEPKWTSFEKVKTFAEKHKLTFLNRGYFDDVVQTQKFF
jgi:hypothetical protein